MWTSCDIDILVHETDLEKAVSALTSELQYTADDKKNYHDISLHSPNGIHLELHFNIQENIETLNRVLSRVWQYAKPVDKTAYRHEMTNEFLLFHIIAHLSYHFVTGGCGVRPVIDLWLLLNALHFDQCELDALLSDANLTQFFESVKSLASVWLDGKPLSCYHKASLAHADYGSALLVQADFLRQIEKFYAGAFIQ